MVRLRLIPTILGVSAVALPLYVAGTAGLLDISGAQAPQAPPRAARPDPGITDLLADGGPLAAPAAPAALSPGICSPALADMLAAEGLAQADRARELDLRAQYLEAMERRVADQLAALATARAEVAALVEERATMAAADLARLVTIYENMKPKDAARLLNGQETAIVVDLLDRMRERAAAPILAEMEPAKVNALTRALAERRVLEGDRPPPQTAETLPLTIAPRM